MQVAMIAAVGDNFEIGLDNQLLWRMPADMRHFKETTMGNPIIVGRKTYESFGAKPLPGRLNIVISRNIEYPGNGAVVVTNIDDAIEVAKSSSTEEKEIMIIGGASFYEQCLPLAQRLYLTFVHSAFEADAYFPAVDFSQWDEISREDYPADDKNPYPYSFVTFQRKN